MSVKGNLRKKYELVPPEGGWGYMIAVAVVINYTTTTTFQGSFGLLYNDFMKNIGMGSTHMTMMMGVNAMCAAVSAFLTSPLLSVLSMRMATLVGAILFNIGVFGTVFANGILPFTLCVGMLQGIGLGIIYNISTTILNSYFVKKRLLMIGLTQTLVALAAMLTPMLSKWLLQEYGYRGTILLISGLVMNNFIAVTIINPVEKHMKKIEIVDNEMNVLLPNEKSNDKPISTPVIKLTEIEVHELKNIDIKSSDSGENASVLRNISDFLFDKSLRETFLLSCTSLGPALSIFSDSTYIYMLPQALYAAKWTQDDVTLAISMMGFGDLAMRIVLIFISSWLLKLGSEEIYIIGVVLALLARLGALWSKSLILNLIYVTLTGMAHCGIVILFPIVIADAVEPHQFTKALGSCMLMIGVMNLILGPAIGAVRDLSESYGAAFYLLASCFAIVTLFWLIELCYKRNQHKRIQRREYLKQKKLIKG